MKNFHKPKLLSNTEIAAFCRQTALIIQAGITPADGMNILVHDTLHKEGRDLLTSIAASCNQGNRFHQAIESTDVFPQYMVKLIALGEESGKLDTVLLSLADYYEKEENISQSIRSAVTYPFIMIVMMFLVILVLIVKVLPIFKQVFVQLGTQMSPFASSLLSLGNALSRYSLILTALLFLLVGLGIFFYHTKNGRIKIKRFLTWFPLTREFFHRISAGRFAGGMYLGISSGMDTYQNLDFVNEIVENEAMQKKIYICRSEIEKNSNLPEALSKAGIFSNLYSRLIAVGFRSGSVDLVMKQIAEHYDEETDKQMNRMISIIEPTLVIILSLVVGMILMSVLLPLMGIMSSIG